MRCLAHATTNENRESDSYRSSPRAPFSTWPKQGTQSHSKERWRKRADNINLGSTPERKHKDGLTIGAYGSVKTGKSSSRQTKKPVGASCTLITTD